MRVARVYTNRTCNQNCAFCDVREPSEDPDFIRPAAVRQRIAQAASLAKTVVLTGGEPTMRRDLEALVRAAKSHGASVHLETNGTLLDAERIDVLRDAGLDLVRLHLPAWGDAADAITRDPGGFEPALRAASASLAAGVQLEISVPVVRANEHTLATIPGELTRVGVVPSCLVSRVPTQAPDPETLLPLDRAAAAIESFEAAARRHDIPVRLEPQTYVPPCLFDSPARVANIFALTPGGAQRNGYGHVEACERCRVRDRCPGIPLSSMAGLPALRPIETDRIRRRLSVIESVDEQIRRELYQEDIHRDPGEPPRPGRTVRINFRCNQSCRFCFVSTHLPQARDEAVRDAIVESARQGGYVAISGGEPTLNPRLVEYVRMARREGAHTIELQTNATLLGDGALAAELAQAGLDVAFVSLHASNAELSDRITGAPGTFDKTVRGVDALVAAGIETRINFVFCTANASDFPDHVTAVADRWPEACLTVSFVAASTDVVPKSADLMPRYTDVLPHLAEGLRIAARRGVRVAGFESMCGIPPCLVPADMSEIFLLAPVPDGHDGGEFVKADACRRCDLDGRCFGVRRGYAELHGTDEFRPIATEGAVAPSR